MSTAASTSDRAVAAPRRLSASRRIVLVAVVLGVAATLLRIVLVLRGGGIAGTGNYDDGVYFGAAEALLRGRVPYLDFLFLQPPGILVALAPFAALAPAVGDAHAFEIARLAGYVFAGATTALVVLAMRRVGVTAAAAAGIVFAVIEPAVFTSRSTLLEPIGAFASAAVLAAFAGAPRGRGRGRVLAVISGLLLGLSVAVKIWALVQLAVFLVAGRRRHPVLIAAGALVAIIVLFVPFFVLDPAGMWRQVVLDQLGRPRLDPVLLDRLGDVVQTPPFLGSNPFAAVDSAPDRPAPLLPQVFLGLDLQVATAIVLVLVVLLAVAGWRYPIARLATVQFVVGVLLLLATPSFYDHYAELVTPFLAVLVGGGVGGIVRRVRVRRRRRVASVVALALVGLYCAAGLPGSGADFMLNPKVGSQLVTRVAALRGCVLSDDPTVLVLTNRLSRDLTTGCPFWPDLTGWSLDADRPPADADPATYELKDDAAFQRRMLGYFDRGDAVVLGRASGRLSRATLDALAPLAHVEMKRYLVTIQPR